MRTQSERRPAVEPEPQKRTCWAAEPVALHLFGGEALLTQDPSSGGWTWTGKGADGSHGTAGGGTRYGTREEAAAYMGAFLREHGS
ncbi:hypothetical protein [Kitasatospora sp. NPDC047058]|uniref:hypothetical protein n=1 Tax=Kitasatospora sp. NPDC047058 TaxID=3155620 RepID=UPI0033E11748